MAGFLLTFLLFGLLIELGTGIALWVIGFWGTTIFSFILLHLFVGLILWIPLLFYAFPHSFGEIGFKFFGFLLPKGQSGSKSQRDRLYHFSAFLLLLLVFLTFVLGTYLTVVGVPLKREWLLQVHILSGLMALGFLAIHLRRIFSHINKGKLGLLTLFFYLFLVERSF